MPTQMTQQEYERVYGSLPTVHSDTFDTTPAPIRMTQQEYDALYKTKPETKQSMWSAFIPGSNLKDIKSDFTEAKQSIGDYVSYKTQQQARLSKNAKETPGKTLVDDALIKTGTALSTGFGIAGIAGMSAVKMMLPQAVEDKVGKFFSDYGEAVGERAQSQLQDMRDSEDPMDNEAAAFVDEVTDLWKTDERFRDEISAVGGFTEVLGTSLFPGFGNKGKATKVTEALDETPTTRRLSRTEKDLLNTEGRYVDTRNANNAIKDAGAASRARIAETDVLVGATDADGLIRTKQPGGAVERYKSIRIDGVEDVVKKNLEREGKTVSLPEIKSRLTQSIVDGKLEGGDLVTALRGVEKELKGLSLRADELQQIPLSKLQDAKISAYSNIDFNKPTDKAYRRSIARAYKEIIEEKSDFNVKAVNAELSKYYDDIARLERLDGKRAPGGKLGKAFAQTTGTLIGGFAGSAGGPGGAALGSAFGGEVAARLKGRQMASTFGKATGNKVPINDILAQAKKEAKLPKGRSLDVPDKAVGAPKGVPKTKEIAKIERQIADNIRQQKAAIKAKDYTLVQALKEVYDTLVERLKETIRFVRENAGDNKGALNPKYTNKIHPDDRKAMEHFINSQRLDDVAVNKRLDEQADILMERLNISPDKDANKIADIFQQYLDGERKMPDLNKTGRPFKGEGKAPSATTKTTDLLEEARKSQTRQDLYKNKAFQELKTKEETLKAKAQSEGGDAIREWRKTLNEIREIEDAVLENEQMFRKNFQRQKDLELRANDPTVDNLTAKQTNELKEVAKQYKDFEEFASKVRGSATQYGDYTPKLRKFVTPTAKRVSEIDGVDPNQYVTIYRGIDNGGRNLKINKGDFVTTNFDEAAAYTDSPANVAQMRVRVKDLIEEYPDDFDPETFAEYGSEFIYQPDEIIKITDTQLNDIWVQVNK